MTFKELHTVHWQCKVVSSTYQQVALTVLSLGIIHHRIRVCTLKKYKSSSKRCRQGQLACGKGKGWLRSAQRHSQSSQAPGDGRWRR